MRVRVDTPTVPIPGWVIEHPDLDPVHLVSYCRLALDAVTCQNVEPDQHPDIARLVEIGAVRVTGTRVELVVNPPARPAVAPSRIPRSPAIPDRNGAR